MNIKLNLLSKSCLLGAMLLLFTHHALAAAGTVKIKGKIMSNICTLSVPDYTINLQKVSAKQIKLDSGGIIVPFVLNLTDCGSGTSGVALEFQGVQDENDATLLKIEAGSQSATGVAIAIYDQNKKLLPLNTLSSVIPLEASATNVSIPLSARYLANGVDIQPGAANSTATLMLHYN